MTADLTQNTGVGGEKPPLLVMSSISKSYGAAVALHPLDLIVPEGSFTAILGPSGCGKSTLLRLMAGFTVPTSGRVLIKGQDVTNVGPEKRPTNMVFQGYGLFPHMTVAENVAFGLRIAKTPRHEVEKRVADALDLVRLRHLADRKIDAMSGGQQQRVALARALIMRPLVLLLDEPLAALDLKLRQAMQDELRRIHRETGGTFIFVTHDQGEAFSLADNLVVMNEGRIEQIGAPQQVYMAPRSLFVSQFVGDTNIIFAQRENNQAVLDIGRTVTSAGRSGKVTFILRPEAITLTPGGDEAGIRGVVRDIVLLGSEARVTLEVNGRTLHARFNDPRYGEGLRIGEAVWMTWTPDALREVEVEP